MTRHQSSKTMRKRVVINPIEIKKRVEDATKKAEANEKIKTKTKELKKIKESISSDIQLKD
jgi:hypothetical protein